MRLLIRNPILVVLLFIAFAAGCATDPGEKIENQKKPFNQFPTRSLTVYEGFAYAGTDSGLYRKPINPNNTEWAPLGLHTKKVLNVVFLSGNKWLAAVRISDFGEGIPSLFLSANQGQSWQAHMGNYGGETGKFTWVGAINSPAPPSDTVFARVGGRTVVRSVNGGDSWGVLNGQWDSWGGTAALVKVDQYHPDRIWAGGSNAIFQPHLVKSEDGGKTWTNLSSNLQIIENAIFEAEVNDIIVNPDQSSQLLLGLSVGVFRSTDEGASWDSVFTKASIETFAMSPDKPVQIYASGQNTAGSLFFVQSNDFGDTWQQVTVPGAPDGIRVNDMVSVMAEGREVLYFATNKGVYSYNFEE